MKRGVVALLAFIAGAALLVLGVPRTMGALTMLPSSPVLKRMQYLEPVQAEDLEVLIASQERGLSWGESGRKWTDLGFAQLLLAEKLDPGDPERQGLLDEAMASTKAGLALAPANPYAWTRLAYAEVLNAGPSPAVVPKLRMALRTAPYEPRLMFVRLELCFLAWPYFQRQDRDPIFRQIRYAWRKKPGDLVELALRTGRVNLVRAALLPTPEDRSEFEERVKRRSP